MKQTAASFGVLSMLLIWGCEVERTVGQSEQESDSSGSGSCENCVATLREVDLGAVVSDLAIQLELETDPSSPGVENASIRGLAQLSNGQIIAVGTVNETESLKDDDWGLIAHFTEDGTLLSSQLESSALSGIAGRGTQAVAAGWHGTNPLLARYESDGGWISQLRPDLAVFKDIAVDDSGNRWVAGVSLLGEPTAWLSFHDPLGGRTSLDLPNTLEAGGPTEANAVVSLRDGGALFVGSGLTGDTQERRPWMAAFDADLELRWQAYLSAEFSSGGSFLDVVSMSDRYALAVGVSNDVPGPSVGFFVEIDTADGLASGGSAHPSTDGFTAAAVATNGTTFAINHVANGDDLELSELMTTSEGLTSERKYGFDADDVVVNAMIVLSSGELALGGSRATGDGTVPWLAFVSFHEP